MVNLLRNPFTVLGGSLFLVYGLRQAVAGDAPFFWLLVLASAGVVAFAVHYRLYLGNVSLYVRDGKLGHTNFLGTRQEFATMDMSELRLCSVVYNDGSNLQPYLLGLATSKRCLFTIASADLLSVGDIGRVAAAARIPVAGAWSDQVALRDLNRRYPGALSPLNRLLAGDVRHPKLLSVVITGALVGLIMLVVIIVTLHSQGMV